MLILLKNKIYALQYYLSAVLIKFFLKYKFFYLCSFILRFNLKKIKKIKSNNAQKRCKKTFFMDKNNW